MTITVEELRRKYPEPKRGADFTNDSDYCVGFAFAMEMGLQSPSRDIEHALRLAKPDLRDSDIRFYVVQILTANDCGEFDDAWAWLDKGLSA